MPDREYRTFSLDEVRAVDDGHVLVGHAAVFNTVVDLGFFSEKVAPGAFKKTLADNADVRALFNHDANHLLGRTKSGTLRLHEDDTGLATEIDMPDTTLGRDLMVSVKRKDLDQMSFAFQTIQEEWDESDPNNPIRTLKEVKLFDVSPVTFPAYPTTDVGIGGRSAESILAEHRSSIKPTEKIIEPIQEDHSATDSTTEPDYATASEARRKELERLDLEG